ncbi:MAG: ATP-binding protein [Sphingobacteriales bacterium]
MNIKRRILQEFESYLGVFPVTGVIGPRQVGKTTLTKQLALDASFEYIDLENLANRERLSDPALYFAQFESKNFILDEIQFMPELFPALRGIIDQSRRPGRFIILGSASPEIISKSSESLAGRIGYLELTPFLLSEINSLDKLWLRGGFPLSYLANSDQNSLLWRRNFVSTYIQRDLAQLGLQTDAQIMERFWYILASAQSNLLNIENLSRSLDVSRFTVNRYINFLEGAFMLRLLRPWYTNTNKRLIKSPKLYIRDSGLLHSLLGLETIDSLLNHIQLGSSWEGFVVEQISNSLSISFRSFFYRTVQGAESDMILEKNGKIVAAIEIKHSTRPKLSKGFGIAMVDTKAPHGYLIGKSPDTYKIEKNITVTNLTTFLKDILPSL